MYHREIIYFIELLEEEEGEGGFLITDLRSPEYSELVSNLTRQCYIRRYGAMHTSVLNRIRIWKENIKGVR